jgi:hypothetical protein
MAYSMIPKNLKPMWQVKEILIICAVGQAICKHYVLKFLTIQDAYSLAMMDLLADTDAYNIYQLINSSSSNFISAFTTYYDDYVGTITDTQANAIASAFTDFIWEKIQYE